MKRVLVRSVHDAFDYVMEHYYPVGFEEEALRKDHYAVISIQDSHNGGFGFRFEKSAFCEDVLTLYFDDIDHEVEGAVLFSEEMAQQVINFAIRNRRVETMLIHCYAGQSRSRAVGAFLVKMFGGNNEKYFIHGSPNMHVYEALAKQWEKR